MKLINITAPQYRCEISASCPAVYKSEDGKTFTIIGARVVSQIADKAGPGEEAVKIPADLLLSSLGIADLIEAAERAEKALSKIIDAGNAGNGPGPDAYEALYALRDVLNRIKGGSA